MKIIKDTANIVVLGAWNKAILTPEWVKKNIFPEITNLQVNVPAPHIMDQASYQYNTPDLLFNINGQRFEFRTNSSYEKTVKYTRDILRKLIFTPVTSVGINVAFSEIIENIPDSLKKRLVAEDDIENKINAETLISSSLSKSIQIETNHKLNITILNTSNQYIFDFNFDYNVSDIENVLNIFGENNTIIDDKISIVANLLYELYGFGIENN